MEDDYKYYIKNPQDCCKHELDKFHELVLKGDKVQEAGLKGRINNCKLLGFCLYKKNIIAISSIKRPLKSYVEKIIKKANLDKKWTDLKFEIGYSFTEEAFRKNGISTEIKRRLLSGMKKIEGTIFSTTATPSSQKLLVKNGFVKVGQTYNGDNDNDLKYFERNKSTTFKS